MPKICVYQKKVVLLQRKSEDTMKRILLFLLMSVLSLGAVCAQEIDIEQIRKQAKAGDKQAQYRRILHASGGGL